MQFWLKNHWPGSVQTLESTVDGKTFLVSMYANHTSNSTILSHNYVSLLSHLCACVQVKKIVANEAIALSVTNSKHLLKLEEALGWCTAQWKMLLCIKTIVWVMQFELACLKKKKKNILSDLLLLWYFLASLGMLFIIKTLKNECYVAIQAYVYHFWDFKRLYYHILHVHIIPMYRVYQPYDISRKAKTDNKW